MSAHGGVRATLVCGFALTLAACASRGPALEPVLAEGQPARVELDATPFVPQQRYQCGPAALATAMGAAGADVSADALVGEVYLPGRQGSLQPELVAATRRHMLLPYLMPPTVEALLGSLAGGVPVLVLQKLGAGPFPGWHYAVVVGYDARRDRLVLRSGTERRKEMPARHFLASWDRAGRWALLAVQPGDLPPGAHLMRYMQAAAGLEAVGHRDAAARSYDTAARHWSGESLPRLALANLAYARGDLAGAERGFASAAALDPRDAAARNNRADVLRQLGCGTLARREIELARALAAGGPLAASVEATALRIGAMPEGDAVGCPTD